VLAILYLAELGAQNVRHLQLSSAGRDPCSSHC